MPSVLRMPGIGACLLLAVCVGAQDLFLGKLGGLATPSISEDQTADVVVYGATGAGCIAAIAASRSGAGQVVLLSQNAHLGGMLTGGLQHTDSANDTVIQGITREFFIRTELQYPGRPTDAWYPKGHSPPGWLFESHVAERILTEMLKEATVTVVRDVVSVSAVDMGGTVLQRIALEGHKGIWFSASTWIDASYEGDLLDRVAAMTWGRESAAQYGETHAGRQSPQSIGAAVNPYWDASAHPLQVIPHVAADVPVDVGQADRWVEPYDFRLCMTNSPGHRIPITRPPSYNASEWELWRRIYAVHPPKNLGQAGLGCLGPIPNNYSDCGGKACRKCDMLGMNHGTDMTNGAWGYPNGTTEERKAIWRAHIEFTRGLLWFWSNDSAVPASVRDEIGNLGLCSDEYDSDSDPPHWPHQLYVREAKRLLGDFVWTEHRPSPALIQRSIGLGSYSFDCHVVSRIIQRSGSAGHHQVVKEGRVDVHAEQPVPGPSPSPAAHYSCIAHRCIEVHQGGSSSDPACSGECAPLAKAEWLAVKALSDLSNDNLTLTVRTRGGKNPTYLKKSEKLAADLPADMVMPVYDAQVLHLARPATTLDHTYDLVELPDSEFGASSVIMPPYEIPYDVMLPKATEVTNVLAAVAISSSHVRYNAIRMEPTWMIIGHAAGCAAAMATRTKSRVHDIDVSALQHLLLSQKQKLVP